MEPDAALGVSNGIYIWVKGRPESYAIPLDAEGGDGLLLELPNRGVFSFDLVKKAMGSTEGLFCWPEQ